MMLFIRSIVLLALLLIAPQSSAQNLSEETKTFKRVFRQSRNLPRNLVKQTLALPKGERLELDRDGDGQYDELWYVDTAKRHTRDEVLVVRVLDEDGDMALDGQPDHDSDLYFWDWGGDGVIDAVTDYQDDDGDNDVDQMGLFFEKDWGEPQDDLTVWWAVDVGDDNLLWYDINGTYSQQDCQWRSHFSGDELFYQFRLTPTDVDWVNVQEAPFAFYDVDGDTGSEVAVRLSTLGDVVKNLRFSMDADNDAFGDRAPNYDFSVTALPPAKGLSSASNENESLMIRGVFTQALVSWDRLQDFGREAKWKRVMLTWDEINSNTDAEPDRDSHERWEGVLNATSKHGDFPQVGGPPSSALNKRVEVSDDHVAPIHMYFSDPDQRFHLQHAKYAYLDVDYNFDGVIDAFHTWKDSKGKGSFDIHTVDVDGNGSVDFTRELSGSGKVYALKFDAISPKYIESIDQSLREGQAFIDTALAGLKTVPDTVQEVLDFYSDSLPSYHPETELGLGTQSSPEGARLYVELVRDRLFIHILNTMKKGSDWKQLRKQYRAGDYPGATATVAKVLKVKGRSDDRPFTHRGETYTQFIALELDAQRDIHTLRLEDLRKKHPEFNPSHCVVVEGDFWLAWRPLTHQVDAWDFDGEATISFRSPRNSRDTKTCRIYYIPDGVIPTEYPKLTHAVTENPGDIAWESDAGAYRFYTGQFNFFGKHVARTLPREQRLLFPITDDYRSEQDWGMDALHVGKTSGLGGLTLYVDRQSYPVQNPTGNGDIRFEYRVLGSGPVRAAVEIVATHVIPEAPEKAVMIRAFIYAGQPESEIQVRVPADLKRPQLGIGLQNLEHGVYSGSAKSGYLGVWGVQDPDIGAIGLAIIAPTSQVNGVVDLPEPGERQLMCNMNTQYGKSKGDTGAHLRYWILGDWQRGMQYPTSPTGGNWERRISELAKTKP